MTALHWQVNKSELFKRYGVQVDVNWFKEVTESSEETVREFHGVQVDVNWFKEVTESSEETVREFLEVPKERNKNKHRLNQTGKEDARIYSLSKNSKQQMIMIMITLVR